MLLVPRLAREAIQQVIFFVGGVIRTNHADGRALIFAHLFQTPGDFLKGVFPAYGLEFVVAADQRSAHALAIGGEVEGEASFCA